MTRKSFLLLILSFCFISSLLQARVPVEDIPAPPGFYWEEEAVEKGFFELHLLSDSDHTRTDIFYKIYPRWSTILRQKIDDNKHEVIAYPLGFHAYHPHPARPEEMEPKFIESLEVKFLNILLQLGYTIPKFKPSFVRNKDDKTSLLYTTIDDYLVEIEEKSLEENIKHDFDSFYEEIYQKSSDTKYLLFDGGYEMFLQAFKDYTWISLDWFPSFIPRLFYTILINILSTYDVLEIMIDDVGEEINNGSKIPINQDEEENKKHGPNGFSLMGLESLEKYGLEFVHLLQDLSDENKPFFPITWYVDNGQIPSDLKLALISLLTHNHASEDIFIKGVILKYGMDEGWKTFRALNNLYHLEQKYWRTRPSYIEPDLNPIFPMMNVPFLNTNKQRMYFVDYNEYFYEKGNKYQEGFLIPSYKSYHYYGAFILATRFLQHNLFPNFLVPWAVNFIGQVYKFSVEGSESQEFNLMDNYYTAGSYHAYAFYLLGR